MVTFIVLAIIAYLVVKAWTKEDPNFEHIKRD